LKSHLKKESVWIPAQRIAGMTAFLYLFCHSRENGNPESLFLNIEKQIVYVL